MPYYKTVIVVLRGTAAKLAQRHGCTSQYVTKCLRYEAHSELADAVRKDALTTFKGKRIQLEL